MVEVVAFGTVAEIVGTLVLVFLNGPVKEVPGLFDLVPDLGQVDKTERCAVFINQMLHGNTMEGQVSFPEVKPLLGEIEGLFDQIEIAVLHLLSPG
jgi:hypothetical protein